MLSNCEEWIKLTVGRVSENGRKIVSNSRNKIIFQKLDFPISTSRKKSLNERMLFQVNRKCGNGEFV